MQVRRIRIGRVYRRLFQKLSRLDPLPFSDRAWRALSDENAVLLHVHNEPKLLAGLHEALSRSALPLVAHVANEKQIPRHVVGRVQRWVAASRYIAGWLERANGIASERIEVIYTGVDSAARPPHWTVAAEERERLRARHGIADPRTRVIVFAGRLVREKGVLELLDAFELLRARAREPVALLIAGNVRDSNDPKNEKAVYGRAVLERMRGMRDAHYAGSLHPREMHEFLLAGDVFALPSLWHDPFPTVMLEAAAAGLPIVAAARGGVAEFLEGCDAFEFLASPEDPAALATALERYVGSRADCEAAGRWLRQRIDAEFDWQRVAERFESMYDVLLSREAG